MEPCLEVAVGDVRAVLTDAPYTLAIEMFEGGHDVLGLGPGSSVELIDGSGADRCPETA